MATSEGDNGREKIGGIFITRKYVVASCTFEHIGSFRAGRLKSLSEGAIQTVEVKSYAVDPQSPTKAIQDAIQWLGGAEAPPRSVGIGCYGPFHSLKRSDEKEYGKLDAFQGPLKDENLFKIASDGFGDKIDKGHIAIHTDVSVSALGEALTRMSFTHAEGGLDFEDVLVYLSFNEGVGGGFVQKLDIWSGKHHPEMGQIPVHIHGDDIQKMTRKGARKVSSYRLQNLASELAFKERLGLEASEPFPDRLTDGQVHAGMVQAAYIAQLCASVTHSLAPSIIIIAGDMMRIKGMLQWVRGYFETFMQTRNNSYYSFYDEMRREGGFICCPFLAEPGILGALCIAAEAIRQTRGTVTWLPK